MERMEDRKNARMDFLRAVWEKDLRRAKDMLEGYTEHGEISANAANDEGTSALMIASRTGSAEMALLLIQAGATIGWENKKGATAFSERTRSEPKEFAGDVLLLAALAGDGKSAKKLAEAGAIIQSDRLGMGSAALAAACRKGQEAVARSLLAAGVSPNESDAERGALGIALEHGWDGIVEALLEAKADPNAKIRRGMDITPMRLALSKGRTRAAAALLAAGADIGEFEGAGRAALDRARSSGCGEAASMIERALRSRPEETRDALPEAESEESPRQIPGRARRI